MPENSIELDSLFDCSIPPGSCKIDLTPPSPVLSQYGFCSNLSGPVYISGNSRVVFGNVYVSGNVSHHPRLRTSRRLGLYTYQAERHMRLHWTVTKLFGVKHETVVRRYSDFSERSYYLQIVLFGRYILHLGCCVDLHSDLRLLRPKVHSIVPDDDRLLTACRNGDLSSVRKLLSQAPNRANSVTSVDFPALYFAIEHEHEDIVKELLFHGADVNQRFSDKATSSLAWALKKRNAGIARLLINQGADLEFTNRLGWSLFEYLWVDMEKPQPSCIDFLALLQTSDPDISNFISHTYVHADGWTLLGRVACIGTPDEVSFMLRRGAEVHWKNTYDWNALFEAVYGNKLGNVQILLPYFPDFRDLRDVRGWTLLHVAAEEGHRSIIQFLLEQGMDPKARSWPYKADLPECLIGIACTPSEVARAQSEEREKAYLELVRQVCGESA